MSPTNLPTEFVGITGAFEMTLFCY